MTTVVLITVFLMAVFLFVVDWLWLFILRAIGVLQFAGGGGFGSTS
jgi:preprotein translocase subunit SecE